MPIVTFTSDFGLKDYYAAVIKGALLCKNDQLNIIDISHNVKNYDIVQGAYLIRNAFRSFPLGTIHLVSVGTYFDNKGSFLAVKAEGHFFILPNNGLISLILENHAFEELYELKFEASGDFPLTNVFANAVGHILGLQPFSEIGTTCKKVLQRVSLKPVTSTTDIRGSVIHIDQYENVILNIDQAIFSQVRKDRNFELYYKRTHPINALSQYYYDVPVGEVLCLFNSANYLEIAINMGKAASLLSLNLDDGVQLVFK